MKIALTGHTAGLGAALYQELVLHHHTVVGLSLDNNFDINNIEQIVNAVMPCDIFINNAQTGFRQTELFFAVSQKWLHVPDKKIINISSLLTSVPTTPYYGWHDIEYYTQKIALEEAVRQVRNLKSNWPKICVVKPGPLTTAKTAGIPCDVFAKKLLNIIMTHDELFVEEIAIGQFTMWQDV